MTPYMQSLQCQSIFIIRGEWAPLQRRVDGGGGRGGTEQRVPQEDHLQDLEHEQLEQPQRRPDPAAAATSGSQLGKRRMRHLIMNPVSLLRHILRDKMNCTAAVW